MFSPKYRETCLIFANIHIYYQKLSKLADDERKLRTKIKKEILTELKTDFIKIIEFEQEEGIIKAAPLEKRINEILATYDKRKTTKS